ncbi:MAG: magnesium transporter [bacterium]|nr:magnesium transporter [bacterium]
MPILLPGIRELIEEKADKDIIDILEEASTQDIAELLSQIPSSEALYVFNLLPVELAIDVFEELDTEKENEILGSVDEKKKIAILNRMASDDRADLFEQLNEKHRRYYLSIMKEEEAKDVEELLSYPPDTAGGLMTTDYVTVYEWMSVGDAVKRIREIAKEVDFVYEIYVVNRKDHPVGIITLKDLIMYNPDEPVSKIMKTSMVKARVDNNQEKVAALFSKYDVTTIPVVDRKGIMKGVITVDDVIDVIEEEDTEDMYHFGAAGNPPESYFSAGIFGTARRRMVWLLILVFAGFLSSLVIERYSSTLQAMLILAAFIPVLMGSGGNAGTQAAAVVIRGIAVGDIDFKDIWRVVGREFLVGALVGVGLGGLTALRAILMGEGGLIGFIVGSTMIISVAVATTLGGFLPLIFKKLKWDPALMSGPFVTTIVDVTSLGVYFEIARRMMRLIG